MSVKFLLDAGADAGCVDSFQNTPLYEAVRNGHRSAAQTLMKAGGQLGLKRSGQPLLPGESSSRKRDAGTLLCKVRGA